MGTNAIRMAHNPPAPELLDLTDRMGFLVVNELFDVWERRKTPLDFHLIFRDWHEPDTRAWVRRDRNHPSVIAWSTGNEVGEQYTAEEGAAVAARLRDIVKEEDPTRPTTASMNYAKPQMPFPAATDVISLNYQGEGIRDAPEYADLQGIRTSPLYPAFHQAFPDKLIVSTENAAAVSSRGEYLFPVSSGDQRAGAGWTAAAIPGRSTSARYELYTAPFGSSPDKVFASLDSTSLRRRRFRLERLGLSRRADAVLLRAQLLLRRHRPRWFQEGPLLPVSGALAARLADGAHPAPLDVAGARRAGDAGARLHVRRRRRALPQRQVAGPETERHALNTACAGTTSSTSRERSRSSPTRRARSGPSDAVRTAGAAAALDAARRSCGHFSGRRRSVVRHRARGRSKRIAGASRQTPDSLHGRRPRRDRGDRQRRPDQLRAVPVTPTRGLQRARSRDRSRPQGCDGPHHRHGVRRWIDARCGCDSSSSATS